MKAKKHIICLMVCVFMVSMVSSAVRAESVNGNYNVVEERGGGVTDVLYRNQISGTHNVKKSGKYTFAGEAEISDLYTNHFFTGKKSYEYRFDNMNSKRLVVKVYAAPEPSNQWRDSHITTFTIREGTAMGGFLDGLDPKMRYFIKFISPSHFSGYVK